MADYETILFEVRDRIATITLNRPEVLNALHPPAHRELARAFDLYAADPELRVAVITGAGTRSFCVGSDLKARAETNRDDHPPTGFAGLTRRFDLLKPVIAAVNGAVAGFSLDLVTETDIPIASEKAYFVDPHVSLGLVSSHEMVNMARRVPLHVCLRMALLGSRERMSAQRAYEVGLVTEVVPHAQLMPRARELAEMILTNAPLAVWGTKMGILQGLDLPVERAEEVAAGYLEVVEQSEDYVEGPKSFVEKRKPVWKAR